MAADEAVVRSVEKGDSSPTFRVYGWKPPAVSFGYAQRVRREVPDPRLFVRKSGNQGGDGGRTDLA